MADLPRALLTAPTAPVSAVIATGSNLGNCEAHLARVVDALNNHPDIQVTAVSPLASSAPVGGIAQPDFLNQIVIINTSLAAWELLQFGHTLEQDAVRVRDIRWGPRTLDVDLVTYGDVVSDHPDLTLPHPRAHERAFVLKPWSWADPTAVLEGTPVVDLAAQAADAATVILYEPVIPGQQEGQQP